MALAQVRPDRQMAYPHPVNLLLPRYHHPNQSQTTMNQLSRSKIPTSIPLQTAAASSSTPQ